MERGTRIMDKKQSRLITSLDLGYDNVHVYTWIMSIHSLIMPGGG